VTTPDGELAETADHLLAYLALCVSAEPKAADCLLRTDNGLQWSKAHAPRRLRGLVCRIVEAHRQEGEVWNEQEPGEKLLNGRGVSEDEVADSGDGMRDLKDDDEAGGDGSTRNGGRDGDVVVDEGPHCGGQRRGRGGGRVAGDGGHVGTNDDVAGDVVSEDGRHGGGQRRNRCGGHTCVDEGLFYGRDGGDAGGHARSHGAGANEDAATDVVVDDRRQGGGRRQGRGGGHVSVDGRLVHPCHAGDAGGHAHDHVVGGDDNAAADFVVEDRRKGGGERQGRGGGRAGRDGALVRAGPTPTPPQTSSSTTDHTAAGNARDAAEGMSAPTGEACTHATPVTPVPTHSVTAQVPTTTPPETSSWTTDDMAAADDKYPPNHALVAKGDS